MDAGPVHWLDGCIEEILQSGFDEMEVFSCLKVLSFGLAAFVFTSKGRLNNIGTGVNRVNPRHVGVYCVDSSGHDHAKPSMLYRPNAGQNHSCILLTFLVEFSNVSIAGFPEDAPQGGIREGSKSGWWQL